MLAHGHQRGGSSSSSSAPPPLLAPRMSRHIHLHGVQLQRRRWEKPPAPAGRRRHNGVVPVDGVGGGGGMRQTATEQRALHDEQEEEEEEEEAADALAMHTQGMDWTSSVHVPQETMRGGEKNQRMERGSCKVGRKKVCVREGEKKPKVWTLFRYVSARGCLKKRQKLTRKHIRTGKPGQTRAAALHAHTCRQCRC